MDTLLGFSPVFLFLIGLIMLWPGSELVVRGAIVMGQRLKITPAVMGLTIIAIGTSIPELAVNYTGAASRLAGIETSSLVVGNIIGTGISQITIILGIIGVWYGVAVRRSDLVKIGSFLLVAVLVLWRLSSDGVLSRADGVLMVGIYIAYLYMMLTKSKLAKVLPQKSSLSLKQATALMLGGFLIVIIASDMVVRYGSQVAVTLGMSEAVIGLFLVGFGTSLPELVVSLWAMAKKQPEFSVGNLLGSNVFAILVALGGSAVVSEWEVQPVFLNIDLPFLFAVSVLVLVFFYSRQKLDRREAIILMGIYFMYIALRTVLV